MRHRLRHRFGRAKATSWAGTDYIERRYYNVVNGLTSAALATGPLTERDREMIHRGREFVAWLDSQRTPRGQTFFKTRHLSSIQRLLEKAEARG